MAWRTRWRARRARRRAASGNAPRSEAGVDLDPASTSEHAGHEPPTHGTNRAVGGRAPKVLRRLAGYPERGLEWLAQKRADLADPEYQRLYRGYDQAVDWDPADPRLEALADDMVRDLEQRYEEQVTLEWDLDDPTVVAQLTSLFGNASSPALERLNELTEQRRASDRDSYPRRG